ncbi:chromatin remodeling complex subunit protein [Rutstroemia sp. NJR-2017a BBW]|nr:chromatin remodeling complex subunit protein [Rutstroemia sp. NJR-2017a BBW]
MTTQVISSTKLPESPGPSTSGSHFDTDMTSSLIFVAGILSENSKPLDTKMNSFRSSRERDERLNRPNNSANTPQFTENGRDTPWRRPSVHNQAGPKAAGNAPLAVSNDGYTPITFIRPGPAFIMPEQLDSAYGYAIQRANGTHSGGYAPAPNADPSASRSRGFDHSSAASCFVSQTRFSTRSGLESGEFSYPIFSVSTYTDLSSLKVVSKLPNFSSNDPRNYQGHARDSGDQMQQFAIDNILASNSPTRGLASGDMVPHTSMTGAPARREKIYCDKWVHEGTCAFTQVGCKYKHEMPTDKATQLSLGLSHGFPNWYRRANGLNPSPPTTTVPIIGAGRTTASWRRQDTGSMPGVPTPQENAGFGGQLGKFSKCLDVVPEANIQCRSSFGPIGPPTHPGGHRRLTTPSQQREYNQFMLLPDHGNGEMDHDLIGYSGANSNNSDGQGNQHR